MVKTPYFCPYCGQQEMVQLDAYVDCYRGKPVECLTCGKTTYSLPEVRPEPTVVVSVVEVTQ